jgi:hypothetical protein
MEQRRCSLCDAGNNARPNSGPVFFGGTTASTLRALGGGLTADEPRHRPSAALKQQRGNMDRITALLIWMSITGSAFAACPGTATDCASPTYNALKAATITADVSTASVTATGVTNSLATWTGYLAGLPNPNTVTFGATGFGTNVIAPINTSIIPSTPQVYNYVSTSASGGSCVCSAHENQVVITGAPTAFWWVNLNQLTYSGTGGGSAQHVAGYDQTVRNTFSAGGTANNPQLWGQVAEMDDFTGQPSSATNGTMTTELDLTGHNIDNANNRGIMYQPPPRQCLLYCSAITL